MNSPKSILFLSPFDFVNKGIQVVVKTPTYLSENGWCVHFVVLRDCSKKGSYYYQDPINPIGIKLYRKKMFSLEFIEEKNNSRLVALIYSKLRSYVSIVQLVSHAIEILRINRDIKILYGYGPVGTLACFIVKYIYLWRNLKIVSRFFGITDSEELMSSNLKRLLNWDVVLSLYLKADVCIVTNDGTQGDLVLKTLRSKSLNSLKFWVNGVDEYEKIDKQLCKNLKIKYGIKEDEIVLISISRLASWKRVDRSLKMVSKIINDFNVKNLKFVVVGDGTELENLKNLAMQLKIESNVIFVGAVSNDQVKIFLEAADVFVSTYDLSNVGNPLLEAIRAHKVIFTLNNGDTFKWIKHEKNGFIYDIDVEERFLNQMVKDFLRLINDNDFKNTIIESITLTEKEMLWSWETRLNKELIVLNSL